MPKRVLQGIVVSDAQNKTVVVRVERRVMHPVYKKFVSRSKKYAAHDEDNLCKVGEAVRIEECRPISKRKTWVVLQAAPEAAPVPVRRRRASAAVEPGTEAAAEMASETGGAA
jgi:small subunit ribosomal protein S17